MPCHHTPAADEIPPGLIKSYKVKVWFHGCGQFRPVLPDLIDPGLDVWETVQVHLHKRKMSATYYSLDKTTAPDYVRTVGLFPSQPSVRVAEIGDGNIRRQQHLPRRL